MPQGLQCFDANGQPTFDATSRICRVVGYVVGTLNNPVSGSVTIPSDIYQNNQVFATLQTTNVISYVANAGTITYNGPTITYQNLRTKMIYGVY